MFYYHDIQYVNYILDLPYLEGLELYKLCIGRSKKIDEEREDYKCFKLFLYEAQNGQFEGSYDEYKNRMVSKQEVKTMSKEEKDAEYERISMDVNKIIEMDKKRRNKNVRRINNRQGK